jgi:hypothetical protein
MERLRERHMAALQHAEDAAEERAADDLVTGRAGRSAPQPADDRDVDHETGEVQWRG